MSTARTRHLSAATGAILVLALGLRLLALGYGLDLGDANGTVTNVQVDEREMIYQELDLLGGDWHPGKFLWRGTAPFYIAGAANAAVVGVRALWTGEGWSATLAALDENPSLVFYVHRLLVALCGVWTVAVVMRICRRELGRPHAVVAGLVLAVAPLHVHLSDMGLVDVPWVFFATLVLDRALRAARDPSRANFVLGGVFVGLAAATKYPGGLVGATLILAAWSAARTHGARVVWGRFGGTVLATALTFLAFSPRFVVNPYEYFDAIRAQAEVLDVVEGGPSYVSVLGAHMRYALGVGMGEPVLIAILLGLVAALKPGVVTSDARRVVLFALVFVPTALVAKSPAPRFAVGLAVGMTPIAAIGLMSLVRSRSRGLWIAATLVLVAPGLVRSVAYGLVLLQPDTRPEILAELRRREYAQADVLGIGHRGLPQPFRGKRAFKSLPSELRNGRMTVADVLAHPPRVILRDLGSEEPEEFVWEPFAELVEREYVEVFRVDGHRSPRLGRVEQGYYLLPRTYVPFATPWTTTRPGPGFILYERRP